MAKYVQYIMQQYQGVISMSDNINYVNFLGNTLISLGIPHYDHIQELATLPGHDTLGVKTPLNMGSAIYPVGP